MEKNTLTQTIKNSFSSLSHGQKKVAEFIINHMEEGALLTAFQIGRKVGVSETTVIRLAYALGFSGFSQMQERIRKEWLAGKQISVEEANPSEKEEACVFTNVIDQERMILKQLLKQVNFDDIWEAVDRIIQADRIYIGGFGSSYAASYWFYYTLRQLRESVYISSPTDFLPEDICDLNEKSLVIIFSFPRYRKESLNLLNFAKKQKVKSMVITNRQFSPIGQEAELTLTTEEGLESGHHSVASVVSLLEVIIAGIHERDGKRISDRQQKLEQLYTNQDLFLE